MEYLKAMKKTFRGSLIILEAIIFIAIASVTVVAFIHLLLFLSYTSTLLAVAVFIIVVYFVITTLVYLSR